MALIAGVVLGLGVVASKGARAGRKTAIPFGPFLALGAVVAIFAGHAVISVYVNHFVH